MRPISIFSFTSAMNGRTTSPSLMVRRTPLSLQFQLESDLVAFTFLQTAKPSMSLSPAHHEWLLESTGSEQRLTNQLMDLASSMHAPRRLSENYRSALTPSSLH